MTFAVIAVDGTVTEIPSTTSPAALGSLVGGYLEGLRARGDSGITGYCDEEAALKQGVAGNPLASAILGYDLPLLGPVVLMGTEDPESGIDTDLTRKQWRLIREAAAAFTA